MINHKNISQFVLMLLFFANGCVDNPVAPNVSLNNDFNIKYGQSVYIPGENLLINFSKIVEDSRCPIGIRCFWQGTAKIELVIRHGNEKRIDTVQTYLPQSIIPIGGINNSYLFWVKNVQPYPIWKQTIKKEDYILTLNVSHFTFDSPYSVIKDGTGLFGQVFFTDEPDLRIGYINIYYDSMMR